MTHIDKCVQLNHGFIRVRGSQESDRILVEACHSDGHDVETRLSTDATSMLIDSLVNWVNGKPLCAWAFCSDTNHCGAIMSSVELDTTSSGEVLLFSVHSYRDHFMVMQAINRSQAGMILEALTSWTELKSAQG